MGSARAYAAAALLGAMVLGSLLLWVVIPVAWIWIGAQVYGLSGSGGVGVAVGLLGFVVSLLAVIALLDGLSHRYERVQQARGRATRGHVALESIIVVCSGLALVVFLVVFYLFAGRARVPLDFG